MLPDTQETLKRETDDVLGHLLAGARQLAGEWAISPQVGHVHVVGHGGVGHGGVGTWLGTAPGACAVTGPGCTTCHHRTGCRWCDTGSQACWLLELHVTLCHAGVRCDVSLGACV